MRRVLVFVALVYTLMCGAYAQEVDKAAFYKVFQQNDVKLFDAQLRVLSQLDDKQSGAYTGALLMRKAGVLLVPAEKLVAFKKGRKILEAAISKEADNVEYRFLRFTIQENAPAILGYKSDLTKDKEMILLSYRSLPAVVREAILDYSKKSKLLQLADFN